MLTERTYDSAVFKVFLNIVTFLPFKIVKNMSSQIANQIKIKLCLVSNQLFIKQQQFTSIVFILYTSFAYNCLLEFYNRDLRTKKNYSIFTQRVFTQGWPNSFRTHVSCSRTTNHVSSSHTTGCILTEPQLPVLSYFLHHKCQQSDECTCKRMSSRNINKCKQAVYCVFCLHSSLQSCFCLFICLSVILYCTLLLLVYFFVPLFLYTDVVAVFLFIH